MSLRPACVIGLFALTALVPATAQKAADYVEHKTVAVPDYTGQTLQQVISANVVPGTTLRLFASINPQSPSNGVVKAQKPTPGTRVVPGATPLSLSLDNPPPGLVQTILQGILQNQKNNVKVPNVEGLSQADAARLITAANLRPVPQGNDSGNVTLQSPPAGKSVAPGTQVILTFSPPQTTVPLLVGKTLAQATELLNAVSLQVGVIAGPNTDDSIVSAQAIPAGTRVTLGSSVDLTVAAPYVPPPPPPQVYVPDLIKMTSAEAQQALASVGLTTGNVTGSTDGRVSAQQPTPGAGVPPGATVDLTFTPVPTLPSDSGSPDNSTPTQPPTPTQTQPPPTATQQPPQHTFSWPVLAAAAVGIALLGLLIGKMLPRPHPAAPTAWSAVTTKVSPSVGTRGQPSLRFKLTIRDNVPTVQIRTHGEPALRRLSTTRTAPEPLTTAGKDRP